MRAIRERSKERKFASLERRTSMSVRLTAGRPKLASHYKAGYDG